MVSSLCDGLVVDDEDQVAVAFVRLGDDGPSIDTGTAAGSGSRRGDDQDREAGADARARWSTVDVAAEQLRAKASAERQAEAGAAVLARGRSHRPALKRRNKPAQLFLRHADARCRWTANRTIQSPVALASGRAESVMVPPSVNLAALLMQVQAGTGGA